MSFGETETLNAFVGGWQLVSMTVRRADGSVMHPMGEDAVGQITYSADGLMSCHLMEANRAHLPGHDLDQVSDAAFGRSVRGYSGYFGSFTIDVATATVRHHVAGAWYPNMTGVDQIRRFAFVDKHLILEAEVKDELFRLEWRRHEPTP